MTSTHPGACPMPWNFSIDSTISRYDSTNFCYDSTNFRYDSTFVKSGLRSYWELLFDGVKCNLKLSILLFLWCQLIEMV